MASMSVVKGAEILDPLEAAIEADARDDVGRPNSKASRVRSSNSSISKSRLLFLLSLLLASLLVAADRGVTFRLEDDSTALD